MVNHGLMIWCPKHASNVIQEGRQGPLWHPEGIHRGDGLQRVRPLDSVRPYPEQACQKIVSNLAIKFT